MTEVQHIWHPETGICDLSDKERNETSTIDHIREEWGDLYDVLRERGELKDFYSRLTILVAIEGRFIDNFGFYQEDIPLKQSLIEDGLESEAVANSSKISERDLDRIKELQTATTGVLDFVAEKTPLSIDLIKQLHKTLIRHQDYIETLGSRGIPQKLPVIKGEWRNEQATVTRDGVLCEYCPPLHLQSEMEKLLKFHAQHQKDGVPGEISASWLHHSFTQIHPFQDGNERMARILASIVLLQNRLHPLVRKWQLTDKDNERFHRGDIHSCFYLQQYCAREQAALCKASRKILSELPDGQDVASILAVKRKERIANAPFLRLFDDLARVDPKVSQLIAGVRDVVASALLCDEMGARNLRVDVSCDVVKTLTQCLVQDSRHSYRSARYDKPYRPNCIGRVTVHQPARERKLNLHLFFRYDVSQHQLIASYDITEMDYDSREYRDYRRNEIHLSLHEKDEQAMEIWKQLQPWSKQMTTRLILEALEVFYTK